MKLPKSSNHQVVPRLPPRMPREVFRLTKDLSFELLKKQFKECYDRMLNNEYFSHWKYSAMDSVKIDLALFFISAIDNAQDQIEIDQSIAYLRCVYHPDVNKAAAQLIGAYFPDKYQIIKDSVERLTKKTDPAPAQSVSQI